MNDVSYYHDYISIGWQNGVTFVKKFM